MPNFSEMLESRFEKTGSLLCVGLDPNLSIIRDRLGFETVHDFNREIVLRTKDIALCFKPQIAHYSAYGLEADLKKTIAFIRDVSPDTPVILDAKRGDIGSTAEMYAIEAFSRYEADAVTVNPYLGIDSIKPFLTYKNKGVVVLSKTSNLGSNDFQNLRADGTPVFLHVVRQFENACPSNENLLYVVGGTYPDELVLIRKEIPDKWILVPGLGTQGGQTDSIRTGLRADGGGLIMNYSRSILYPIHTTDRVHHLRAVERVSREIYQKMLGMKQKSA